MEDGKGDGGGNMKDTAETAMDTIMVSNSASRGEKSLLEDSNDAEFLDEDKESQAETLQKKCKEFSDEEGSNRGNKTEKHISHQPLLSRGSSGAPSGRAGRKQYHSNDDDDDDDSSISSNNDKNKKKKFNKVDSTPGRAASRTSSGGGGPKKVTAVTSITPDEDNDMEEDAPIKSLATERGKKPSSDADEDEDDDKDSLSSESESDDEAEEHKIGLKRTRPTRKCRLKSQRRPQRTMTGDDDSEDEELEESHVSSSSVDNDDEDEDEIVSKKSKNGHDRKRAKKNNRRQNDNDESEFDADLSETSSNEAEDEAFMQTLIEQADNGGEGDLDLVQSTKLEETEDPKDRRLRDKVSCGDKPPCSHGGKPIKPKVEALPMPTEHEQAEILSKLENRNDKNLQRLLWSIDCRYNFLPYQFLGVRSLAGVQEDYPQLASNGDDSSTTSRGQDDDESSSDEDGTPLQPLDTQQVLRDTKFREKNRGVLMGDDMGLGKTVQAVGAAMLRNAIAEAKNPKDQKPTIIISPNNAVTQQWADTLIKAGVSKGRIIEFVPKDPEQKLCGTIYVLMDRYKLQTHSKYVFSLAESYLRTPSSHLFPKVPKNLLLRLKNQYESNTACTAKNEYREKGEGACACVTRLLQTGMKSIRNKPAFRTVIIDESHFLKNLLSFWGLGAGLLGLFSERVIPISGTPYNNSSQDLATLMTFIDPNLASANEAWWKQATDEGAAASVAEAVGDWKANMLVRREKTILGDLLKSKTITSRHVSPYPLELDVYEQYEESFLLVLEQFTRLVDDDSPQARFKKKQLFQRMMAGMAQMRMSLIHNMLPGGRDLTIQFSPTRCHLAKSLVKKWQCVCCNKGKKRRTKRAPRSDTMEMLGDDKLNDDDEEEEDGDFDFIITKEEEELIEKGDLMELPLKMCLVCKEGGLRHFAHQECLEALQEDGGNCPLCDKLRARVNLSSGKSKLEEIKRSAAVGGLKSDQTETPRDIDIDRPLYREDILGGFVPSAKLTSIISDLTEIPKEDKVLILSFFKGSLDLLEAMLYELKIGYCRYDGEISHEARQLELDRFKSTPSCRVLLMTVQTGGTGLNICEANHVIFVDRWFNPFVHEQAMDRCHRLGQSKPVFVSNHDVSYTVDVVIRFLNDVKTANANIVLADGSSFGGAASSGVSYKDMTGLLGQGVRAIREARHALLAARRTRNCLASLPPTDSSIFGHPGDKSAPLRTPRSQSQYGSISDVLAQLLGYVIPQNGTNVPRRVTPDVATTKSAPSARAGTKDAPCLASSTVKSSHLGIAGYDDDDDDDDSVAGEKNATNSLTRTGRQRATGRSPLPDWTSSMSSASAQPSKVQSAPLGIAGYEDNHDDDSSLAQKRRAFPAGQKKATSMRNARKHSMLRGGTGSNNKTAHRSGAGRPKSDLVDLCKDDDNSDDKTARAARPKPDIVDLCKDDDSSDDKTAPRAAARPKPDIVDLCKDDDSSDDKTSPRAASRPVSVPSGIIDLCNNGSSDKKSDDDDHDHDDSSVLL